VPKSYPAVLSQWVAEKNSGPENPSLDSPGMPVPPKKAWPIKDALAVKQFFSSKTPPFKKFFPRRCPAHSQIVYDWFLASEK
jgi:hypothetical protein